MTALMYTCAAPPRPFVCRRQAMSAVIDDHGHASDHAHGPAKGLMRWVLTTNHKDIGTMYLWFAFTMFLLGGSFAMVIRAELFQPGLQIVEPAFFNQMTTMHGLVMVFGAVMPAFVGLANWMIPLMIGAPDMALPRMNNFSFWLLPAAFLLLVSTLFTPGGGPNFGWTFYAPLSTTYAPESVTFFIFAIHLMGISSIMGAINVVATILNLRAPGMTLMKMPLFVWTWLITAFLLIAVMPVLAGCVTMMLMDIHFGTSFFSAAGGGDPVLFQHVFWFFGHPEVYIMILPAFGAVSSIIPTFSRKPLFGYTSMVYATASIAFLSFIVWAHHMFVVGIPLVGELFFMYATLADRRADRGKGVQLGQHHVARLADLRDAYAVCRGLRDPVHHRRLLRVDAGHRPGGLPVPRHLLRGGALPLRAGAGRDLRHLRLGLLLAAEMDRPHVRRNPGQAALLAVFRGHEHGVLPDALRRAGRYAASGAGLQPAVRRLQHGLVDRRVHVWRHADLLSVHRDQVHSRWPAGAGQAVGWRRRPGVEHSFACAVPHVHHAAGGQMNRLPHSNCEGGKHPHALIAFASGVCHG